MSKKVVFLTLIILSGLALPRCDISSIECDFGETPNFFEIFDISLVHLNQEQATIETEVARDDYGFLLLSYMVRYVVSHEPTGDFSFASSAYGCTPPAPGENGTKEQALEDLAIITLNDINEDYRANDTINDMILVFEDSEEPTELTDYLDQPRSNVAEELLLLKLKELPESGSELQLRATASFSTGERMFSISSPVNLR